MRGWHDSLFSPSFVCSRQWHTVAEGQAASTRRCHESFTGSVIKPKPPSSAAALCPAYTMPPCGRAGYTQSSGRPLAHYTGRLVTLHSGSQTPSVQSGSSPPPALPFCLSLPGSTWGQLDQLISASARQLPASSTTESAADEEGTGRSMVCVFTLWCLEDWKLSLIDVFHAHCAAFMGHVGESPVSSLP